MLTKYRHFTHRSTIHEMTISLNTPSPSETPSKSTTPNLAYLHRPLLTDARLPGGRQPGSYPETLEFYRKRAFEDGLRVGTMLWRAFDKTETLEFYRKRAFEDGLRVGTMLWRAFDKTV